jgi:hypothetical protein
MSKNKSYNHSSFQEKSNAIDQLEKLFFTHAISKTSLHVIFIQKTFNSQAIQISQ